MAKKDKKKSTEPKPVEIVKEAEAPPSPKPVVADAVATSVIQPHPDIQSQLDAALAEIKSLKSQLASKDIEITTLKQGNPLPTPPPSEDIQKLQERLQQLKKEQAEAESARESAWRNLKSVVGEITRMAASDVSKLPAASTPTGTAQAV